MNMDLVLILSGWLFGLIIAIAFVMLFLKFKTLKSQMSKVKEIVMATIKDDKVSALEKKKLEKASLWIIPDDVDIEQLAKTVIELLDTYWNNPHLKRRAQEIHDKLSVALKKWNDEE